MNQATFLISQYLIEDHPELKELSGSALRDRLHKLLQDPLLWKKMKNLESKKYTKQYQAVGQKLQRVDFYPFPEDWCFLSILSNASGFSRCYIFIYLLRYELGELELEDDGTPDTNENSLNNLIYSCQVILDKKRGIYQRKPETQPEHPHTPAYPPIKLKNP